VICADSWFWDGGIALNLDVISSYSLFCFVCFREANHRTTILNHDVLSHAEIEEYSIRFTESRTQSYLKRYGVHLSQEGKDTVEQQHEQTAETG